MRTVAAASVAIVMTLTAACGAESDDTRAVPEMPAASASNGTPEPATNDEPAPADADTGDENAEEREVENIAYPSPTIVRDGDVFHMYVAKRIVDGKPVNAPHFVGDKDGNWKYVGDALPKVSAKARQNGKNYVIWAPAAAKINAKLWVLHYTATLASATGAKKCLFRAEATSADGPFVDDNPEPLYCAPGTLWAIDPALVQDQATKSWYLAARIDEPGGINTVKIRKLGPRAMEFSTGSEWSTLTQNSPDSWEQPVLENAAVVALAPPKGGDAHYLVFYSGGAWADSSYAIGYADCGTSIVGPCQKKTVKGPWMATDEKEGLFGPGTPTFYENEAGETLMSIQAWKYADGKANPKNVIGQVMRTYRLSVNAKYEPKATLVRIDE